MAGAVQAGRHGDWKIINEQARTKLARLNRHIMTNDEGTVYHLHTAKQYKGADLIAEFGLTLAEAESCFLTL